MDSKKTKIRPRERDAIIQSLRAGVAPHGLHHPGRPGEGREA